MNAVGAQIVSSPNGLEHNIYQHISCDNEINELPFLQ